MLHVHDLADLMLLQIGNFADWEGWCGNVAGGLEVSASLQELTRICEHVTGNTIDISSVTENRPNDLRIFMADCAKLFARTDWRPKRSVRDIVQDTHEWVKEKEDALARMP